jgi:hypothetical protein
VIAIRVCEVKSTLHRRVRDSPTAHTVNFRFIIVNEWIASFPSHHSGDCRHGHGETRRMPILTERESAVDIALNLAHARFEMTCAGGKG